MRLIIISLLLSGCTSIALNRAPQSVTPTEASALRTLEDILRPHVLPLDRDLVTFRYEHDQDGVINPRTIADIVKRETPWAARFFDVTLRTGDDVGPGVFVATDPNATATWGMDTPHLLVLTLKAGMMVLNGDIDLLTPSELAAYKAISQKFACESDDDRKDRPVHTYSELLGAFRVSKNESCRRLIVTTAKRLFLQGIVYSFNSVALPECRATGTAISIVDFSAVDERRINYYDRSSRIEGDSELTPLVSGLFEEGKDDYHAQAYLSEPGIWQSYRGGYGFFDHAPKVDPKQLREWKLNHIFKCGPKWSIETDSVMAQIKRSQLGMIDRELSNLRIETALTYNAMANRLNLAGSKLHAADFSLNSLKPILRFTFRALGGGKREASFETWLNRRITNDGRDDFATIAKRFHEPKLGFQEIAKSFLEPLHDAAPVNNHDALQDLLLRRNYGPHSATYLYNVWQLANGGIPYFSGSITPNLARRAYLRAASREVLMKILRHCHDIYTDPKTTAEDLLKGECRVLPNRS